MYEVSLVNDFFFVVNDRCSYLVKALKKKKAFFDGRQSDDKIGDPF